MVGEIGTFVLAAAEFSVLIAPGTACALGRNKQPLGDQSTIASAASSTSPSAIATGENEHQ